jgi:hypothetical protein
MNAARPVLITVPHAVCRGGTAAPACDAGAPGLARAVARAFDTAAAAAAADRSVDRRVEILSGSQNRSVCDNNRQGCAGTPFGLRVSAAIDALPLPFVIDAHSFPPEWTWALGGDEPSPMLVLLRPSAALRSVDSRLLAAVTSALEVRDGGAAPSVARMVSDATAERAGTVMLVRSGRTGRLVFASVVASRVNWILHQALDAGIADAILLERNDAADAADVAWLADAVVRALLGLGE